MKREAQERGGREHGGGLPISMRYVVKYLQSPLPPAHTVLRVNARAMKRGLCMSLASMHVVVGRL